jgi:chromosome segregation ATPase
VNWKGYLVVAVLAFLAGGVTVWFIGNMGESPDDPALLAQIADLEDEVEGNEHAANEAHAEADELRGQLVALEQELDIGRGAIGHSKSRAKRLPRADETALLTGQVDLLEHALALSRKESLALRRSLTHMGIALTSCRDRCDLLDRRYLALKRTKKSAKRKRIIQQVFTHTGVFVVAWAGGKYSQ